MASNTKVPKFHHPPGVAVKYVLLGFSLWDPGDLQHTYRKGNSSTSDSEDLKALSEATWGNVPEVRAWNYTHLRQTQLIQIDPRPTWVQEKAKRPTTTSSALQKRHEQTKEPILVQYHNILQN